MNVLLLCSVIVFGIVAVAEKSLLAAGLALLSAGLIWHIH